jgi:UPF0042 nucleotide-binding protein
LRVNTEKNPVVLVSGLSGGGKASILRALEDLGFEAVDNPPLPLIEDLAARSERPIAIGVDCRTRGFDADTVLAVLGRLRKREKLRPELVFAEATDEILQRRFTETRRRHPLAPQGRVADGIAAEQALTAPLRAAADLLIDTSDLPPAALRQRIEQHFGRNPGSSAQGGMQGGMAVSLVSFAFAGGLPRDADLVFDARFLRNPHYDPILRPRTGLDPEVGAHVAADPDYASFLDQVVRLIILVLPRFVQEGKKYATIAIGCTGGRHRSVHLVEALTAHLRGAGWNVLITHRELARESIRPMDSRPEARQEDPLDAPTGARTAPDTGRNPAKRLPPIRHRRPETTK